MKPSRNRHGALRWVLIPEAAQASTGQCVQVERDKLNHLRKVLRMEWDEQLRVLDGCGRVFEGRLEKSADRAMIRLEALIRTEPQRHQIELVIGAAKNATMDWIVEKAVECGVTSITPVVCARSVVRPHVEETEKYVRRWQVIMDEAVEQSERLWRPSIAAPLPWGEWLGSVAANPRRSFAFVSELRLAKTDEQAFSETWDQLRASKGEHLRALVGPEGGFAEAERDDLHRAGFIELSLGGFGASR
jgi:16S rRNA (uracil1498-N3)-methyltransferase